MCNIESSGFNLTMSTSLRYLYLGLQRYSRLTVCTNTDRGLMLVCSWCIVTSSSRFILSCQGWMPDFGNKMALLAAYLSPHYRSGTHLNVIGMSAAPFAISCQLYPANTVFCATGPALSLRIADWESNRFPVRVF